MSNNNFYITTPIYYVNDRPHLGHAYTSIACDVLARFKRLQGYRVRFLTGTDEHGLKVEKSAGAAGLAPQAFVDGVSNHFRNLTDDLKLSNDDFIRTTEPRHIRAAQALWRRMRENGHLYLGSYAGWYAVRDEAYYQESELVGGRAPTGAEVEWVEEPSYFFDLSRWQDKLLEFYEKNPDFILPASRRNEVISFVRGGLKDLSVSRTTFSWGIAVPDDEKHIMYVWLDALANYLAALGYPAEGGDFEAFWPADLHMVGKDILRFHAVYWPAFLMAADLPLPKQVFAHGWWTVEGEKMSKSLGNAISAQDLIAEFGLDQTRYFLLREVPFGGDGNFSRENFINRINSELANNIGNLAQRTLAMIQKNCAGAVPDDRARHDDDNKYSINTDHYMQYAYAMDSKSFDKALDIIVKLSTLSNEYIDRQAPWTLKKDNPPRMEATLYRLAENIRWIAIMLQPFIPESSGRILDQLAVPPQERDMAHLSHAHALRPATLLPPPQAVFPRLGGQKT